MSANINITCKALYELHHAVGLPARIAAASFLATREAVNYYPQLQSTVNSLSFLRKIPTLGLLPYEKLALQTLSLSHFAVALSCLSKITSDGRQFVIKSSPGDKAIALAATLTGFQELFGERIGNFPLPPVLKDLATSLWTAGSLLSCKEMQAHIDKIRNSESQNKESVIGSLKTIQLQLLVFATTGILTQLGRHISGLKSPLMQITLKLAPIAVSLFGAWKNSLSTSSQLVNRSSDSFTPNFVKESI